MLRGGFSLKTFFKEMHLSALASFKYHRFVNGWKRIHLCTAEPDVVRREGKRVIFSAR